MADWEEKFEGGMIDLPEQRTEVVNRKIVPVIFMIDASDNRKIDALNNTLHEILRDLDKYYNGADCDMRYAVLSFSDACAWNTNGLQRFNYDYKEIEVGNLSNFNSACLELNSKLTRGPQGLFEFDSIVTFISPIVILISCHSATDGDSDGKDGIDVLIHNKYFKGAFKLAIALGDNANHNLCNNFTRDKELVITSFNQSFLIHRLLQPKIVIEEFTSSEEMGDYLIDDYIFY